MNDIQSKITALTDKLMEDYSKGRIIDEIKMFAYPDKDIIIDILEKDVRRYQELLDECDKEIERLTSENSKTKQENEYLKLLLKKRNKLKKKKV